MIAKVKKWSGLLPWFFVLCFVPVFALAQSGAPLQRDDASAGGSGGGLTPAQADLTYLRLDTANDPLTGDLTVDVIGSQDGNDLILTAGPRSGASTATSVTIEETKANALVPLLHVARGNNRVALKVGSSPSYNTTGISMLQNIFRLINAVIDADGATSYNGRVYVNESDGFEVDGPIFGADIVGETNSVAGALKLYGPTDTSLSYAVAVGNTAASASGSGRLFGVGTDLDTTPNFVFFVDENDGVYTEALIGPGGLVTVNDDLEVTGQSDLQGIVRNTNGASPVRIVDTEGLDLDGPFDVDGPISNTFGSVEVDDSLTVTGSISDPGGDLSLNDNVAFGGNVYNTTGDFIIADAVRVTGNVELEGTVLDVQGAISDTTGSLSIVDDVVITGGQILTGALDVRGDIEDTLDNIVTVNDALQVTGAVSNPAPGTPLNLSDTDGVQVNGALQIQDYADFSSQSSAPITCGAGFRGTMYYVENGSGSALCLCRRTGAVAISSEGTPPGC